MPFFTRRGTLTISSTGLFGTGGAQAFAAGFSRCEGRLAGQQRGAARTMRRRRCVETTLRRGGGKSNMVLRRNAQRKVPRFTQNACLRRSTTRLAPPRRAPQHNTGVRIDAYAARAVATRAPLGRNALAPSAMRSSLHPRVCGGAHTRKQTMNGVVKGRCSAAIGLAARTAQGTGRGPSLHGSRFVPKTAAQRPARGRAPRVQCGQMPALRDVEPPWHRYPRSEPTWSGWRQGHSEAWLLETWLPFWCGLAGDQRAAYLRRWPPPCEAWRVRLLDHWV